MEKHQEKSKTIIQRLAPTLWILAGVLFLLPSIFGSSNNHASIGVGMMFIILGIVFSRKKIAMHINRLGKSYES